MRVGDSDRSKRRFGVASQQSRESRHRSLKRNHGDIDPGHRFENLDSEMVDGPYAQSSAAKLSGILLGVVDHLGKILPRGFGLYPDTIRESDVKGQRIEIPKGIVRNLLRIKSRIVN